MGLVIQLLMLVVAKRDIRFKTIKRGFVSRGAVPVIATP